MLVKLVVKYVPTYTKDTGKKDKQTKKMLELSEDLTIDLLQLYQRRNTCSVEIF